MKTKDLFALLSLHPNKKLQFEYLPNTYVNGNYHITEVKSNKIYSVDCGGRLDSWNETIVQLWESPSEPITKESMSVYKALAILKKVNRIRPLDLESEVKIEFGNGSFHTTQLEVLDVEVFKSQLVVKLSLSQTQCKATVLCGVTKKEMPLKQEECCTSDHCC